jgi:hypothetical protein
MAVTSTRRLWALPRVSSVDPEDIVPLDKENGTTRSILVSDFLEDVAGALPVGTTPGTIAAGDDTRITGAAQRAANLADIATPSAARTNLGLGTAATLDTASQAEAEAGTVNNRGMTPLRATQAINKRLPFFDVTDARYGAVGNDSTDSTTAINAAIAAAIAAGGGVVFFPAGIYRTSAVLNVISTPGITLMGAGHGATIIRNTSASANSLRIHASNAVRCVGICFDSTVTRAFGSRYIDITFGPYPVIEHCRFVGHYTAIYDLGLNTRILSCIFENAVSGGFVVCLAAGDTSPLIHGCLFSGPASPQPSAGIYITNSSALILSDCSLIRQGQSLFINPPSGIGVYSLYAANTFFDSAVTGMTIAPSTGGFVQRCSFSRCWFSSHSSNGVSIDGTPVTTGSIDGLDFQGCEFYNNAGSGVVITGGANVTNFTFDHCKMAGNASAAASFNGTCTHWAARNCTMAPTNGFGANAFGLFFAATCDHYIIAGNDFSGNGTATTLPSAASSTKIIGLNKF